MMSDYSKIKDLVCVIDRNVTNVSSERYYLIEKKPCRRTISAELFRVGRWDADIRFYNLPFPYMYFLIDLYQISKAYYFMNFYCFFSHKKITFSSKLMGTPLPNQNYHSTVCLGDDYKKHKKLGKCEHTIINSLIESFWGSNFIDLLGFDFEANGKQIGDFESWQKLSVDEMMGFKGLESYDSLALRMVNCDGSKLVWERSPNELWEQSNG